MKRTIIFALLLLPIQFLIGCAVNISPSISLPFVPVKDGMPDVGKGAMVFVDEIKDLRPEKAIGRGPAGPIITESSIGGTARGAFEELLRKSGFTVTESAPTVVHVELRKWFTTYRGGVPAGLNAEAEIALQVFDPGNKLAYSGTYAGSASIEGSGLDDLAVKETLSSSLAQALEQVSKDKQLMKLLAAF